jgi:hypothetical protein
LSEDRRLPDERGRRPDHTAIHSDDHFVQHDLILTISKNYTYHELHVFLESLRRVGYRGETAVFVEEHTGRNTVRAIKRSGALPILYSERNIPYHLFGRVIDRPIHLYNYRHFLYYQYLTARLTELRSVMLSDVRDVYFQQDPFARAGDDALRFSLEDDTLGACAINSGWLRAGYDEDAAAQIGGNRISCAGTILGPAKRMQEYLRLMIDEIYRLKDPYACADQAAHNYLLYTGRLDGCRLEDNQSGRIWTMSNTTEQVRSANGRYLNANGEEFVALHQYDRNGQVLHDIQCVLYGSIARRRLMKAVYKVLK